MTIIEEPKLYDKAKAEKMVQELSAGDPDWTYSAALDHATGLYFVEAWDEDCQMAGAF